MFIPGNKENTYLVSHLLPPSEKPTHKTLNRLKRIISILNHLVTWPFGC